MNDISYNIRYTDPLGNILVNVINFISLEYARKQNEVGKLQLVLPARDYSIDSFIFGQKPRVDCRIEVWRKIHNNNQYLDTETAWLMRDFSSERRSSGEQVYIIEAVDSIDILDRRIIPYNEGMELLYADKSQEADDMMKAIMEENFGPTALDADRDLSDWVIIQGDFTLAPSIRKSFSRRNVLTTLKEIAEASLDLGTPLFFDLVYLPDTAQFEFRTYIDHRGPDRSVSGSNSPIIISEKTGNLTDASIEYDHSDSRNFIYAGGQSAGQVRSVWEEYDTNDINMSPFNRRELFVNASDTDDDDELETEAQHALEQNRGRVIFGGKIVDTNYIRYGVHYRYGHKITAEFENKQYDCVVDAISVKVDEGGERIDARLKSVIYDTSDGGAS